MRLRILSEFLLLISVVAKTNSIHQVVTFYQQEIEIDIVTRSVVNVAGILGRFIRRSFSQKIPVFKSKVYNG